LIMVSCGKKDDHRARNYCRGKHMGVRSFQTVVPMRDGARLNTFVFLPESGGPRSRKVTRVQHLGEFWRGGAPTTRRITRWSPASRGADSAYVGGT
jgi:predicted acyl esterase